MRLLPSVVTRFLGRAAGAFHHIERVGPALPDGPVLVVANHPNSLLDPLVIFRIAGRSTRPLAKAPLFEQPGVGLLLRAMNGLPVYRREDHPDLMDRNEDTFRAAIDALGRGEAVQIYPEGISHNEPQLQPLKTGAARIALGAEEAAGWELGLLIVPVGLTYSRQKTLYRSRAVARVGDVIRVDDWRAAYETDEQAAVRELTAEIGRRMTTVTLNLAEREDRGLIETAERLWAAEKTLAGWRERPELAERLPRLQAFARGLGWLREHDPERHARLARAVRRHQRRLAVIRAGEGEAPPAYTLGDAIRYSTRKVLLLLLTFVPGVAGMVLWAPPYRLTRLLVRRIDPPREDTIATYKLGAALLAYPLSWALLVALAWWWLGPAAAAVASVLLWPLGALGIYWKRRSQQLIEDVRLFFRLVTRPDWRAELAADRRRLVAEFDEIWERAKREG
ncbi:MAG: 1-acyl-sn-glycerol-3-phosphate acyltransferase [Candidatus Longimicrobiales bacterium M2_2A_002]